MLQVLYEKSHTKASAIWTEVIIDIVSTAVSKIIIAVDIVSLIITEAIANNIRNKPNNTIFKMKTSTIRTVISVDVHTAISTIIVAISIVALIIAIAISNQFQVRTIWKSWKIPKSNLANIQYQLFIDEYGLSLSECSTQ